MFCIFLFLLLNVFALWAYLFLKEKSSYWKNRNVAHAKYWFPFGSIASIVFLQTPLSHYCYKLYQQHEHLPYIGFYNFYSPALVVRDIDLVKDVLVTKFNHFRNNWISVDASIDPVIAKNPFVLKDDEWKIVRQQLAPQYSISKFKQLVPMIEQSGRAMIDYMSKNIQGANRKCFEIKDLTLRYASDAVLKSVFGLEGKSFEMDVPITFQIGDAITDSGFMVAIKQTIGFFFPLLLRKLFNATFLGSATPKIFWDLCLDTIQYREKNNILRKDYLDFIKDLRKPGASSYEVTDADMVAHAFTFYIDSLETSSITLNFALYELAQNSEVQAKARHEVEEILKKYDWKITYEAIAEMGYIENIIFETIRKHSVLAVLSRICTKECTFPLPGETTTDKYLLIEKGTQIFISARGIHNDPLYYPEPQEFDPDRFNTEAKKNRPKLAFLGFGEGPRTCLGKNYAIIQIKVALALLLHNFEFWVNSDCKPMEVTPLHIFTAPIHDILIDFYKLS